MVFLCLFAYLLWIDQTRKMVYGASCGKERYPCIFLGWKLFQPVEDVCFTTDFSHVYPPCPSLHWNLSLYFWCLLWSYLDVWVALYELENNGSKRKKPSVLINLAKWSEHFLRETMLHVGKIEAGAHPVMLTARCKWMQTHLPKNSRVSKNEFGVQGPQTIPDLTVFYP